MKSVLFRVCSAVATVCLFAVFAGCGRNKIECVEWPAMGTVAAVKVRGDLADCDHIGCPTSFVRTCFDNVEKDLSRFNPDSELNRLAPLTEEEILATCDPQNRACYATAFLLMHESGGAFNPRWRGTNTLDLGAIAKGFALDCSTDDVCQDFPGILLDLGGNLKSVCGEWKVGIAGSDETLVLTNGMACATSGEYFRGKHIKDGRTGAAITNGVYSVTVVHPTSAMLADGLSTTLFVLGKDEGEKFLKKFYPEARAYWVMK